MSEQPTIEEMKLVFSNKANHELLRKTLVFAQNYAVKALELASSIVNREVNNNRPYQVLAELERVLGKCEVSYPDFWRLFDLLTENKLDPF